MSLFFDYPEDEDNNISEALMTDYLPIDTASHARRLSLL
jgi:hypothetical protein